MELRVEVAQVVGYGMHSIFEDEHRRTWRTVEDVTPTHAKTDFICKCELIGDYPITIKGIYTESQQEIALTRDAVREYLKVVD